MDKPTYTLVLLVGLVFGFTAGFILGEYDTVRKSDLERNGYFVVRHEETHGEFRTNWVEVIRK